MASLEPCSMVPVYDNYESDPWESHEGEKEELNVQLISCPTLVNEKISPGISQPASILYPPVHSENIKQQVSNDEIKEVISYQLSVPYYKFYDPVGLYMELSFPKALEPAKLFILSSFGGIVSDPKHVFILLSYFPYLLWIICSEREELYYQTVWVAMVEVFFHLAHCKKSVSLGLYINKLLLEHVCLFSFCK
jgi:hypothetical protein